MPKLNNSFFGAATMAMRVVRLANPHTMIMTDKQIMKSDLALQYNELYDNYMKYGFQRKPRLKKKSAQ